MSEGVVFDIQHYAVHDGPGIRTLVFLKGCPLRCAWCCNPESQSFEPELMYSLVRCRSHFACEASCPAGAVSRAGAAPAFDREICRACVSRPCVEACPSGALAVAGRLMRADEIVARVAADRPFYDNSGGGVTFSGGEPFAQPEFLRELLAGSKSLRIRTAVETCGHVEPGVMEDLEPLVDLFLFDVKTLDRERHRAMTGFSNDLLLENLEALARKRAEDITVRVPLIPGQTDDRENLDAISTFVRGIGLGRVEVMPYHPLGMDKYAALGRGYTLEGAESLEAEAVEACAVVFRAAGLVCEVGS